MPSPASKADRRGALRIPTDADALARRRAGQVAIDSSDSTPKRLTLRKAGRARQVSTDFCWTALLTSAVRRLS